MENILDSEFDSDRNNFLESGIFQKMNKIDSVILVIICLLRIKLIRDWIKLEEENEFIGLNSYREIESGWTFVIIISLLLINLNIARGNFRSIYWSAKLTGFMSLIYLTNYSYLLANIFYMIIFIFYLSNNVSEKFMPKNNNKIFYFIIGIIGIILIGYLESEIRLFYY